MKEYKINKAVVRIHGTYEKENVEKATIKFIKSTEKEKKKNGKSIFRNSNCS